jgi:hypothetical protein
MGERNNGTWPQVEPYIWSLLEDSWLSWRKLAPREAPTSVTCLNPE